MSIGIYRIEYHSTDILNDREMAEKLSDRFTDDDGIIRLSWSEYHEWLEDMLNEDPEIYSRHGNQSFWAGIEREFGKLFEKEAKWFEEHGNKSLVREDGTRIELDPYLELSISW